MRLTKWLEQGDHPEIVQQERLTEIAYQLERIADAMEDSP